MPPKTGSIPDVGVNTKPYAAGMLPIIGLAFAAISFQPAATPRPVITADTHAAVFAGGAVAADHELASQAGAEMLARGGNAVDAAVATSFALSVVRPFSCGIGGGGFMVIKFCNDDKHGDVAIAINYREQAPAWATPDCYTKLPEESKPSVYGPAAVATPGTVAGLLYAHEQFGSLPRSIVLAPAIRLAQNGFAVDAAYMDAAEDVTKWVTATPARRAEYAEFARIYLLDGHVALGSKITLPGHADALRLIAERGADGFYKGPVADAIAAASRVTASDLQKFKVRDMPPMKCSFRGRTVLTMPPPSSGGIVLTQVLSVLERRPEAFAKNDRADPTFLHFYLEASKHAFADRARHLGDPDFNTLPLDNLLSPAMLDERAKKIDPTRVLPIEDYGWMPAAPANPTRDAGTSHLSVVDSHGNAVACTETINLAFGSCVVAKPYGFVLNNQMDDFLTRPGKPNAFGLTQSERNLPSPGKRPLSSMTPTIVLNSNDKVELVAGASGGPKIISATLQSVIGVIAFGQTAEQAVNAGRVHHQWKPDEVQLERSLFELDALTSSLKKSNHKLATKRASAIGVAQVLHPVSGDIEAASDPRKGGKPAGVSR